jgi:two-component system response regulator RegA
MSARPVLLLVEADENLRQRLAHAIAQRGFETAEAATTDAAEAWLSGDIPEFVVLDLRVPGAGGLSLVSRFHDADPNTRIVVLTGYGSIATGSIATAVEAMRRGATQYLTKPADADQIVAAFGPGGGDVAIAGTMSLDRMEWEHINRVLIDAGGNISEAARVLGLHRRSLQRKLSKFPRPQ